VAVLNLVQDPGRITFDTKLDLQISPGAFLLRSLTLWNPDSALGELQNQASGYAFPLGPAYALGQLLHVPMWIWERGISAVLMVLAFEGMRRLALAWGGLGTQAAFLAGLFYMLSPRLLSTVGALTGETLPSAILPWTVLPLVLCLRGRLSVGRAVVYSVATIPLMGGQNATEVLAALTLPAVVLVVNGQPWTTRLRMFASWVGGAVLASLWWLVPLVLLGRYGSPFLEYVESARTTTGQIGWLSALRGTDHWVAFVGAGDSSSWRTGAELTSSRFLLVSTTVAAVIGLLGLASSRLPRRYSLLVVLVIGLFTLTAGRGGPAASVLGGPWTTLLDGPLAPFRNVHKFDPAVRVALALGFAAAAEVVLRRRVGGRRTRPRRTALVLTAALAVPVVAASMPMFRGELRDSSGFTAIPVAWHRAADYLRSQPGVVRSLVVPASGFAVQTWGRSIDEPMQVVAGDPWTARTQTPLAPAGTIRWLNLVEAAVAAGRPDPEFASLLARAGITHVVVRNYAVRAGADDPRVRLLDAADAVSVVGGPEALGPLVAGDVVGDDQAVLSPTGTGAPDVLTDTLQKIERNFGGVHDVTSQVMTRDEPFRSSRPVHDYLDDPPGAQTVARYTGVSEVRASTSAGYADSIGLVVPAEGPYAAVDGSPTTSWVTAPYAEARGSWIDLRFRRPTVLGDITMHFDVVNGARVRVIAVDTDSGRRTARVDDDGNVSGLRMETAPTRSVRFTVVDAVVTSRPVMLPEIAIDGVPIGRTLVVPGSAAADTSVVLSSPAPRPSCMPFYAGLSCRATYQRLSAEGIGWMRDLDVTQRGTWTISGSVVATGGYPVAALMSPLSPAQVRVGGSSWYGGDPSTVPQNAFDGSPATVWVSAPDDRRPVLDFSWDKPRTISRVIPRLLPGTPGRLPDRMLVESDGRSQSVTLGEFGTGLIDPVRTSHLRVTLIREADGPDDSPVAVSEFVIKGLEGRTYHAPENAPTGSVCGFGPQIVVDGRTILTRVRGTIGDVVRGAPLELTPCGAGPREIRLEPGARRISVENAGGFAVTTLVLRSAGAASYASRSGTARVEGWGATDRTVRVSADAPALLAVTQSRNPGWQATLGGKRLEPVELDGWMQGWRVPAGSDGIVKLRFTPQLPYLVGLLGGLAIALLLMVAAGWSLVRRRAGGTFLAEVDDRPLSRGPVVLSLAVLAVLSAPVGVGALVGVVLVARRRATAVAVALIVALGLTAIVVAFARLDTNLVAPDVADLLMAAGFGIMAGRVVGEARARSGSDDG
jgi:arabinofuranan 3-O-arabinosyltransferase